MEAISRIYREQLLKIYKKTNNAIGNRQKDRKWQRKPKLSIKTWKDEHSQSEKLKLKQWGTVSNSPDWEENVSNDNTKYKQRCRKTSTLTAISAGVNWHSYQNSPTLLPQKFLLGTYSALRDPQAYTGRHEHSHFINVYNGKNSDTAKGPSVLPHLDYF